MQKIPSPDAEKIILQMISSFSELGKLFRDAGNRMVEAFLFALSDSDRKQMAKKYKKRIRYEKMMKRIQKLPSR